MDKTIKPAYLAHPVLILTIAYFSVLGFFNTGGFPFIFSIIAAFFFLGLLLFSVKGVSYKIKDGQLFIKRWSGDTRALRLSEVMQYTIKNRSFGTGDVILKTPAGKTKIKKLKRNDLKIICDHVNV